ncbi:hypothetical protein Bhyg_11329 [Pseudolycoriella hygida]|uniref:Hemolymph juvenile hormone binding protein n=1 Tax=Pseudolycoriella hygida TaxID=35572 RepID=A0A9Q0MXS9_9DIPT|nr:hypothetical protein Bhyg_11329 [Pseudolycoriella hygida]
MYSSLKFVCLVVVFATCLCKSDAFVVPRNESELDGGPCRNFTNQNILDILEELRIRMHLPIPRFNIPPLHPLFIEHITLDNFDLLTGLNISMHNISFVGFRDFQMRDLDFNLLGFNFTLQMLIPQLNISGHHVSNGSLYGLVPVIGEGPVNLQIANLLFDVAGQMNHTNIEWETTDMNINFTITGITGGFENLTDNFFNELLNLSGPEILELAWPGLQPTVQDSVAWAFTEFFNDFNINELMGFLFGAGMDWSDVDNPTTVAPPPTAPASP